jgi:sensor histidine kinase YesM
MADLLTSRQKWQLALRLLIFYSPVMFYVNMPSTEKNDIFSPLFFGIAAVFLCLTMVMYFIWITFTDWIQYKIGIWWGKDFLMKFSLLALGISIIIALGLSIAYTFTLRFTIKTLLGIIFPLWPSLIPRSRPPAVSADMWYYITRSNQGFSVVIMFSAFYLTLNFRAYQQLKDVQLKTEQLEKEAVMAQFAALKSQINPHFLFNSLSILNSLMHEDVNLSARFVQQLSKAYRYILEQRDQELISLSTELDFIESYTFLLKIRFENKFDVRINVPPDIRNNSQITPLALQMLVENAVKHNRMSVSEPLWVDIYYKAPFLVVENPLQLRDQADESTGVGLSNIANRYALLTDMQVSHEIVNNSYIVKIPLL